MNIVIMDRFEGPIERSRGSLDDAKRVLRQWCNPDDTLSVESPDDNGIVRVHINTPGGYCDIYAAWRP